MERAKRIATALIGVAFAANCCEPSVAQSPSRFIRQPVKVTEPTNPSPAATILPKSVGETPGFPALADSASLKFDALESFATVPNAGSDKPTTLEQDLAEPSNAVIFSPKVTSTQTLTAQTTQFAPARSNQLQWTSRSGSPLRAPSRHASATTPPQFIAHSLSSASTPPPDTQSNLHSTATTKQQPPSTNELLNHIATRVEAIESQFEKAVEPAKQDRIRASLVSARITNDPRFAIASAVQPSVTPIESPQGWQSIQTRLSEHVAKCECLLRRGAFCSAREEAEMASMLLFRHIDLHDNLFRCEPAMQAANQALREAEDFVVAMRSTADGDSLRRLVDAHKTPVLKNNNLSDMSPLAAAQHYRQFAESQLTEAAQGHPWASELLYTVGRTYQAEADAASNNIDVLRMKALAYYRASRVTMPTNAIACNQLGYLLLQMDRNEEAREALVAAVELKKDEAFLSNLAEASRRLGDMKTVTWANQSVAAIRSRTPPASPVPSIVEVSQEDFIAISPRAIGPKNPIESGAGVSIPTTDRSATVMNAQQLR